jgi:hypothetical protein
VPDSIDEKLTAAGKENKAILNEVTKNEIVSIIAYAQSFLS